MFAGVDTEASSDDDKPPNTLLLPPSPQTAHTCPDKIDNASATDLAPPPAGRGAAASVNGAAVSHGGGRGHDSKPPSSNLGSGSPGSKPKSFRSAAPRAPSPLTPSAPARQPLETVRLEIKLGGPDDYEVNISELAGFTGQRMTECHSARSGGSEGEDESAADAGAKQKGKQRRKHHASRHYDVTDPFIDDSNLAEDERTFFAETKLKGFYASIGEVELRERQTTRMPRSTKAISNPVSAGSSTATLPLPTLTSTAASSINHYSSSASNRAIVGDGTCDAPYILSSDDEAHDDAIIMPSSHIIVLYSDDDEGSESFKQKASESKSIASSAQGGAKKRRRTTSARLSDPNVQKVIKE